MQLFFFSVNVISLGIIEHLGIIWILVIFLNNVCGKALMNFMKCLWECEMIENHIWLIRFSWKPGVTFQE